jgi:hypothetical protein
MAYNHFLIQVINFKLIDCNLFFIKWIYHNHNIINKIFYIIKNKIDKKSYNIYKFYSL